MRPLTPDDPGDHTSQLLSDFHAGDAEALHALMVDNLDWISSYVHRHLGGVVRRNAETGDVVQEVFLKTMRSGPQFVVSSQSMFRKLMARIITNTLISMARHYTAKARSPELEQPGGRDSLLYLDGASPVHPVTEPIDRAARDEEAERIRLAMELLEPIDREILLLRDREELTYHEIGDRVGLAEEATRKRYTRGVQKLMKAVALLEDGKLEDALDQTKA